MQTRCDIYWLTNCVKCFRQFWFVRSKYWHTPNFTWISCREFQSILSGDNQLEFLVRIFQSDIYRKREAFRIFFPHIVIWLAELSLSLPLSMLLCRWELQKRKSDIKFSDKNAISKEKQIGWPFFFFSVIICIPNAFLSHCEEDFNITYSQGRMIFERIWKIVAFTENYYLKWMGGKCSSEHNIHTSKSSVAGSDSALNLARGPNVSGADQCCAWLNGLPRTSKLQVNKKS